MTGPFHSLAISSSGMDVYQTWLDAIADNVANVNNVAPPGEPAYQERFVVSQSANIDGRPAGAVVARAEFGSGVGRDVYQPEHPYADENGLVRVPDMNLSDQMTHMLIAQRAYQANVSAFRAGRDAYLRALEIGR
jgi:flagellar basal-body rod protein FlgC